MVEGIFVNKLRNGGNAFYSYPRNCILCNNKIKSWGVLKEFWARSKKIKEFVGVICNDCNHPSKTNRSLYDVTSSNTVMISRTIPRDSFPYIPQPPALSTNRKNLSVFDIADNQIGNETTDDQTIHSGRLQKDYDPDLLMKRDQALLERDEYLNSSVSEAEAESLLTSLASSDEDLLEDDDKKLLSDSSNE